MAALEWDKIENRTGENGADHGVIYRLDQTGAYKNAEVWDGLTAVNMAPEGAEAQKMYADNILYGTLRGAETSKGTIEAFRFPESFRECDGTKLIDAAVEGLYATGQQRQPFGFSWRTLILDSNGTEIGYKIHLTYGNTASPSSQDNSTINESPEYKSFSWEFESVPVPVPGLRPSARLELDSRKVPAKKMEAALDVLYGRKTDPAKLPTPAELVALMKAAN